MGCHNASTSRSPKHAHFNDNVKVSEIPCEQRCSKRKFNSLNDTNQGTCCGKKGRRGKRLNETTPLAIMRVNLPPPEVTDEFLYAHINEMIEIMELKSKLIADWFRPAECQN
ncbi:hypothetical protein CEXT_290441 [Caerostris extrusa]|uniref:Uncharacterized protein n=1 Tax=Caerostris extrusa TaxID=172846 RepID=A0AAV4YCN8_CAEEX|nr:hypothetical protein CEXT_290441 [Caerostris extrusa]